MNIDRATSIGFTALGSLSPGDVFQRGEAMYLLLMDPPTPPANANVVELGRMRGVDLRTGCIESFRAEEPVIPCSAQCTVEAMAKIGTEAMAGIGTAAGTIRGAVMMARNPSGG
ncbi:MAG TPA: hypothetical protein VJ957_03935 [Longimicrobiales bacterium]|nr:hypothetical protein [Longimicrobiales bacterium]